MWVLRDGYGRKFYAAVSLSIWRSEFILICNRLLLLLYGFQCCCKSEGSSKHVSERMMLELGLEDFEGQESSRGKGSRV